MKYVVVISLVLLGCSGEPPPARVITFPEAALFESGQAELKPEGKDIITEYRERAREALGSADQVVITGYTDSVGEEAHNSTLRCSVQKRSAIT